MLLLTSERCPNGHHVSPITNILHSPRRSSVSFSWTPGMGLFAHRVLCPQLAAVHASPGYFEASMALWPADGRQAPHCASHIVAPMWHMTRMDLASTTKCTTLPTGGGGSKKVTDVSGSVSHSLAVTGVLSFHPFPSSAASPPPHAILPDVSSPVLGCMAKFWPHACPFLQSLSIACHSTCPMCNTRPCHAAMDSGVLC